MTEKRGKGTGGSRNFGGGRKEVCMLENTDPRPRRGAGETNPIPPTAEWRGEKATESNDPRASRPRFKRQKNLTGDCLPWGKNAK